MPCEFFFGQVPVSLISEIFTVLNFQNVIKVVHLKKHFEEELVEVENGKWKCPHILNVC